jgi:hypothetical protein
MSLDQRQHIYAGTEGNGLTLVNSRDWQTYPGTVGRAVPGPGSIDFEVQLRRAPTGKLHKQALRDRYWRSTPVS